MSLMSPGVDLGEEYSDTESMTRMIILGPKANISETELAHRLQILELPLTIKSTCYGALVYGKKEDVMTAIKAIREVDPYNVFTKERGFPPGDPRRCQGHRGGPREGFHQLEKEFEILGYVGECLENPKKVSLEKKKKVPFEEFKEILKEVESQKTNDNDNK